MAFLSATARSTSFAPLPTSPSRWTLQPLPMLALTGKKPQRRVFKVDLPGNVNNEVKLEVEDGNTVQTKKSRKSSWRFILSENVKIDNVRTAMENGVLIVTVPKEEIKKTAIKSIEISG